MSLKRRSYFFPEIIFTSRYYPPLLFQTQRVVYINEMWRYNVSPKSVRGKYHMNDQFTNGSICCQAVEIAPVRYESHLDAQSQCVFIWYSLPKLQNSWPDHGEGFSTQVLSIDKAFSFDLGSKWSTCVMTKSLKRSLQREEALFKPIRVSTLFEYFSGARRMPR